MIEPRFSGTAHEPRAATDGDRRGGDRYRTVWRIAKVVRDNDVGLWRVRNISDRGMQLAADVPLHVDENLDIYLSDSVVLKGKIVWADGGRCGVAFHEEIDGAGVLKQLAAEQRAYGYRAPRIPLHSRAKAQVDGVESIIELVDMSQSGAGFVHGGHLEGGRHLHLTLADGLERKAIVRWARGGRGGLWFTEPLNRVDLESIRRFEG